MYDVNLCHKMTTSDAFEENLYENIVGKGENVGNQHFLIFLRCFLSMKNKTIVLVHI